jgi:hypothetical protein
MPALIVQFDHLKAGGIALRMAGIRPARQRALYRSGALLPELFDGFVIKAVVALILNDPGQLAQWATRIACLEAGQCCHDCVRDRLPPAWTAKLCVLGKEAEGANHLIAPLALSDKVEFELGNIRQGGPPCGSLLSPL